MNIINESNAKSNCLLNSSEKFAARFGLNSIIRTCGIVKKCGIEAYLVFTFLLSLVFTRKNLWRTIEDEGRGVGFGKDTVYRMLNDKTINWEFLQKKTALAVIPEVRQLTNEDRRCVLIVDDTTYYRDRSKKVELLSRCFDHVEHKYYKGFSVLTLGWSDGITFMPVDYRLLASSGDDVLVESTVKEDGRTIATKRRKDAKTPKPKLVLNMLENVKGSVAQCPHVVMDSWFTNPQSLSDIKALGYDAVGRLKKDKTRFLYNGQKMNVTQIYNANKKRRGTSKYLLSIEATIERDGKQTAVRLVFVRNKNKRKDWIVLVTTDMALMEEDIITLYGKRWDIEPFFKVCKSYLNLEGEFQSRSFDAIAGHVAIVFIRYTMLSLMNRESKDDRSVCAIFYAVCKELPDLTLAAALSLVLRLLEEFTSQFQKINKLLLEDFCKDFIAFLPDSLRERLTV